MIWTLNVYYTVNGNFKNLSLLLDISIRGFWLSRWMDENAATDKLSQMYDHLTVLALSGQLSPPKHQVTISPSNLYSYFSKN